MQTLLYECGLHVLHIHILTVFQAGVFNISNKLFVTLDILLEMRSHIQQGEPVTNCCHAYIEAAGLGGEQLHLSSQEQVYMEQKLYDGYFAFEALSEHNWDCGVCDICGVAPVFERHNSHAILGQTHNNIVDYALLERFSPALYETCMCTNQNVKTLLTIIRLCQRLTTYDYVMQGCVDIAMLPYT